MWVDALVQINISDRDLRDNNLDLKATFAEVLGVDTNAIIGELTWAFDSQREYDALDDPESPISRMTIDGEPVYVDDEEVEDA
jgi:hypothetical protein